MANRRRLRSSLESDPRSHDVAGSSSSTAPVCCRSHQSLAALRVAFGGYGQSRLAATSSRPAGQRECTTAEQGDCRGRGIGRSWPRIAARGRGGHNRGPMPALSSGLHVALDPAPLRNPEPTLARPSTRITVSCGSASCRACSSSTRRPALKRVRHRELQSPRESCLRRFGTQ